MCDPDSDGAAIALLKRAVELDMSRRFTEALVCYKEGLQLLLEFIKVGWCSVTRPLPGHVSWVSLSDNQ